MPNATATHTCAVDQMKYSGFDTLKEALDAHRSWIFDKAGGRRADLSGADLSGADLSGTNLTGANLTGANLTGANLSGARLSGADLTGADLSDADLTGAYLGGANLTSANLTGANLTGANLSDAYLSGADLSGASLSDTLRWEQYISDVVPALCIAGGKSLAEVAAAWDCHAWSNCPMKIAFGADSLEEVPAMYRLEVKRFVQFFDAKLIPNPLSPCATGGTE